MIRSMTGFGDSERSAGATRLRVEIRTVNHRFFHPRIRTPSGLERLAGDVEVRLKSFISRGHVAYSLSIERADEPPDGRLPELDVARARRYWELLGRLREELGLRDEITLDQMTGFRDLFRISEPGAEEMEIDPELLGELTEEAALGVVTMREREGEKLQADLEARLAGIEEELDRIEGALPARLAAESERLRRVIGELTEGMDVDEDRLAREIAYLAEKRDINEELVRFRAHVHFFQEIVAAPSAEPVGKRLGFVVQEMLREANTVGAKANHVEMGRSVVRMKEEIERLREQLDNVE